MDLTTGKIGEHIRRLAIPTSIGFFFNTMYNVVDTVFAGLISTEALAALSISFPAFFIMIAFVNGLATGASALISNAIGSGDEWEAEKISAQILVFSAITYFVILPFCLAISPILFRFLGAEGDYLKMAVTYMNIIFKGSLFFMLLYSANAILMSHGNTKVIRNYLVGGFFLNAFLDPWFIFGGFGLPQMGFAGVAVATVLVMLIGWVYIFWEVIRAGHLSRVTFWDFIPSPTYFSAIAKQSIPASLNMMTIGTGIFVITYFVKNFGHKAVAAYGICMRIEQIILLPTIGLTVAALSIIGQNNGAGRFDRIRETIQKSLNWGFMVIAVGSVFMFFIPRYLMRVFTSDAEVIAIGVDYLKIAAFTAGAYVVLAVNVSALQGMKRPAYPLVLGILRQLIVPVTVFHLLTVNLHLGIQSIWGGIFSINWMAAFFTYFYCRYVLKHAQNTD